MNRPVIFNFRLYVADNAPNSTEALTNLTALCQAHLQDRYHIEVVDVFRESKRALADGICMTPTLVKLTPSPTRTIVGRLNDMQMVLRALGLQTVVVWMTRAQPQGAYPANRTPARFNGQQVDKFIKHFIGGQAGWWECVSPVEIDGPNGRIQVALGSRFFPGAAFMGADLAEHLTAEYERSREAGRATGT